MGLISKYDHDGPLHAARKALWIRALATKRVTDAEIVEVCHDQTQVAVLVASLRLAGVIILDASAKKTG